MATTKKIDIAQTALDAVDSIINGNTSTVIKEISSLPKRQAVGVVGYIVHYLALSVEGEKMLSYFLRRLERLAD